MLNKKILHRQLQVWIMAAVSAPLAIYGGKASWTWSLAIGLICILLCIAVLKLENIKYDCREDNIKIELFNPIFNVKIALTFLDIRITFTIKGEWSENRETVVSLTAEEDFSYLQNYLLKHNKCMEDSLYLLFQMFSGD